MPQSSNKEYIEFEKRPALKTSNYKLIIGLFIWFLFVVSDICRDYLIKEISVHAVDGRTLTSWGVIMQGLLLVVGYIILVYCTDQDII